MSISCASGTSCQESDRDRIIHATAFRRLEHKTQVLASFAGDHFRTRLTHSLEVAQIARTLARALQVDEDLCEAIALAHDLGHSPFGHAGETALDAALREFGGFDHNLQTFRILTRLERRYAGFDGLNLTLETLEGVVKHNGPLTTAPPAPIAAHALADRVDLATFAPLEAQIASLADDIAYCSHDLDDGMRAGFFELDELAGVPLAGAALAEVDKDHPGLEPARRRFETVRRLIDRMVREVALETRRRLGETAPGSPDELRRCGRAMAAFGPVVAEGLPGLRRFLRLRVYDHYKVRRTARRAGRLVADLVEALMAEPLCLPDPWRPVEAGDRAALAELVRDYIAGMTDRFALDEHDRLFKLGRPYS